MHKRTCSWPGTWSDIQKDFGARRFKTWCSHIHIYAHAPWHPLTRLAQTWPFSTSLTATQTHMTHSPFTHSLRCTYIHTVRTASWYEVRGLNGSILYRVCDGRSSVWLERLLPILAIFPHLSGARPSKWGLNTIRSTERYEIASWWSRVWSSSLDIISWNTLRFAFYCLIGDT